MNTVVTPTKSLVGPKICIMGLGGTGKTYSLGTLVDWAAKNDFEVAVLFVEAGLETLLGYWKDRGLLVPANLYYHQQSTQPVSLDAMTSMAEQVGRLSYKAITDLVDINRSSNNAFWKILSSCKDFVDDRTGKKLGPVDKFPPKRIFVVDSLTELGNAAFKMQIGARPTASPGDYGVAQGALMNFLRLCTQGIDCPFVMTAHVDRETDAVTQSTKIMIKAIGKALATEIPTLFSDVIYTVREGDKFFWDTAAYGVDVKTRSLGYRSKINPDFGQILDLWKKRAAV